MKDFSRKTLNAIGRKNIFVISAQAAPAFEGDTTFSGKVYNLSNDGCGMMRTHSQVMELAR